MEQRTVNHKGSSLHYRTTGSGPAIILLHGFGEDGSVWKNQFAIFHQNLLIVPDLPGSGSSELVDDMSMEGLAEVVHTILEAENVSTCILIGHSMGGYITLAFAEKYMNRLSGFGLFHSTAYADSEEKKEIRQKGIEFIQKNGAAAFLKTSISNLYSSVSKEKNPKWIEEHVNSAKDFSDEALVRYNRSMIARPDRTAVLKDSTVPVLFILGREDSAVPVQHGLEQCYMPQEAHVHILNHSGHMGMIEEAEKTNKYLLSFVNCVPKP